MRQRVAAKSTRTSMCSTSIIIGAAPAHWSHPQARHIFIGQSGWPAGRPRLASGQVAMLLQWYNKKQLPPSVVMKKAEASNCLVEEAEPGGGSDGADWHMSLSMAQAHARGRTRAAEYTSMYVAGFFSYIEVGCGPRESNPGGNLVQPRLILD
ncbi:hypothetical protein HaLaN_31140 [Haematococcus lacustris]|uniref:Uncharacterized protein n=1 Tax=Haematococcus lacustris TaxID=44745 RepID=A0A6A0AGX8_HAELA|nr:hypothetical protein HaLaN_31140 [Haematococcus lacustris]